MVRVTPGDAVFPRASSEPLTALLPLDGRIGPEWLTGQAVDLARTHALTLLGLGTARSGDRAGLEAWTARCRAAGATCEARERPGRRASQVLAASGEADFVLLAQPSGVAGPLGALSSTFGTVLRQATRPLWVAHSGATPPQALTVAFHGQRGGFHAVAQAARFAHAWGLPVDLLVVAQGQDINDHDVLIGQQELRARGVIERRTRYERGVPGEVLAGVCAPDHLLVMGGAGDGPLFGLIASSTVRGVLRGAGGPVLLCP